MLIENIIEFLRNNMYKLCGIEFANVQGEAHSYLKVSEAGVWLSRTILSKRRVY